MSEGVIKRSKETISFVSLEEGPWTGSSLAEVFPTDGSTKMSCGIHTIRSCRTTVPSPPVDEVLYLLDGEMDIVSEGVVSHFAKGDFVYLRPGVPRTFIVPKQVTHVYVTYPCRWK